MYIKFFGNKSGGSKSSVNYLLNERVNEGTAKVLKGNPEFTKAIIGEIKNKHKVTFGSINLKEGETLTRLQKEKVMEEFEKTLLPGLDQDQYNILWVEHTDKGRLELNFVVPKIELSTKKALNPYYHKADFTRIDMFEDIQNIKYNLQSKKDPANAQTLQGSKKEINLVKDYKELDNALHDLVKNRDIQNREQMIDLLNENNIKVTRQNKEGISVKLPDSKKAHKLKGSIYNEQFTSTQELEVLSEATDRRVKEFQSRDTSRELERTKQKLEQFNEQKASLNREKYPQRSEQTTRLENTQHSGSEQSNSRTIVGSNNRERVHTKKQVDSTNTTATHNRGNELSKVSTERHPRNEQQTVSVYQDKRGIDYDFRRRTLERIRARAEEQAVSYRQNRKARTELYQSITEQSKVIRAELEQNSIKLSREHEPTIQQSRELAQRTSEVAQESEHSVRFFDEFNEAVTTRERITNAVKSIFERVKEFGTELKERFSTAIQQSADTTRTAKENIDYKEQQSYSRGYSMSR